MNDFDDMMNIIMSILKSELGQSLIGFLVLGILALVVKNTLFAGPDIFTWNQKVTLTVETLNGVFSSSTVQQVSWKYYGPSISPGLEQKTWSAEHFGESPVVILPNGSAVFTSMSGGRNISSGYRRGLVNEVEEYKRVIPKNPSLDAVTKVIDADRVETELEYPTKGLPQLFGLSSSSDPFSTFIVSPEDATTQSLGILNVTISIEKTSEPVSEPVAGEKLPALLAIPGHERIPVETAAMTPYSILGTQ